jgi:rSAM/selenodomain-associated transferase 1
MPPEKSGSGLIVFLRLPVLGNVKTRLALTLGPERALRIYKELLDTTFQVVSKSEASVYLFYDGGLPPKAERIQAFSYHLQTEGTLGRRMTNALSDILTKHEKVVIIGSDCPGISAELINKSFTSLEDCDVIIGPSEDGGCYLIGCRKLTPSFFESVEWSTEHVLDQTVEKIRQQGLTFQLLETLMDIDTESDWQQHLLNTSSLL